ncbi:MAG: hypothetical protein ACP5D9_03860 [Mariniphaga sp.]
MKQMLIFSAILFNLSVLAQDTQKTAYLSVELDPAPFMLKGYSFSLKYGPKKTPKMAFMASVYSSEFPNSMMSTVNKENGWTDLNLEVSYAFFTEFFMKNNKRGFYFGPSVFLYNKSVVLSSVNERIEFTTLYPNIRAGYKWYPFKKIDLYLNPWFNIGSEINIDNNNKLQRIVFEPSKFYYIAAIHLGYSINW